MNLLFDQCKTLAELNQRRKHLLETDVSEMEINKQFNKAKMVLNESKGPACRRIPKYTAEPDTTHMYCVMPLFKSADGTNSIYITERGIEL